MSIKHHLGGVGRTDSAGVDPSAMRIGPGHFPAFIARSGAPFSGQGMGMWGRAFEALQRRAVNLHGGVAPAQGPLQEAGPGSIDL